MAKKSDWFRLTSDIFNERQKFLRDWIVVYENNGEVGECLDLDLPPEYDAVTTGSI